MKGWGNVPYNTNPKKSGVTINIKQSRFQSKQYCKTGLLLIIKRSIYQEDVTILNIYAPNNGTLKCVKQTRTIMRNRKIHNYSQRFQYLIDIYRTRHPKILIHILFQCTRILSRQTIKQLSINLKELKSQSISFDQMELNWNLIAININQLKYKYCHK